MTNAADTPEVLWRPTSEQIVGSRIQAFREWLRGQRGVQLADYDELWRFSVEDPAGFWGGLAEFLGVRWHEPPRSVLDGARMPDTKWFPGSTLNYAEHALSRGVAGATKADDELAVIHRREDGVEGELTYGELRSQVAAARAALAELGVGKGDRVVALAPNCPQTLVAFLATASLGATWSSCSPDFGVRAVADRFTQIEPKVLIAVNGYVYNGRSFDVRPTVDQLRRDIPSLAATVLVEYVGDGELDGTLDWDALLDKHSGAELAFEPVPFDHPLWVLYSSGTTGLPKGIVHGHGGIVVEHLKALALQSDLGPGDRFFWFTTTGWMMWNFLIGGLLVGTTIVLFDGSPGQPDLGALWRLADERKITYFGTSAPFIQSCLKARLEPGADHDLSSLRAIGSTGSPLSVEGFRWIAGKIGEHVQICSVSGGTDLCAAFVCAAPDLPVWLGELSCRALGAAVASYDDDGNEVVEEVGELVVTQPMPSMPVFFWNDPDGTRLREAYFDYYPGVWRHGDWIRITERGSAVIYGRSDSTLNRGGVRMGTAEFYRVVEGLDEIADSLVIDTTSAGNTNGELLCFVVMATRASLADVEPDLRKVLRAELSPRHVPDRFVEVAEVPRTLNGKKCEVPVKKILAGMALDRAVSRDALANPAALQPFIELARGS
ncbi:acetoacetate--CoA ligase [Amycolatopsis acidiphila]|uniref:Acetoacetate--CoA ligase n=1 Tax=Amycolatopsis acidiphila TaxID=715473 RepID=A0A558AMV3_9PSEU|nr:acetoacetate--CoA ligase [Amycolatopsis acidiphila]TVT25592.1 acetoacetate--CoA ligase [Amycolatopsis acidiphila]UIJ60344.1 acetoacetate--CoA ligase [Amycolatopsis acidiphila]GHG90585.1 acetoacetyl-CoA synthetase [Amycolatopsis acidiphila]